MDSALLRELGERLIGRPEIALAELAKNSYDADARTCSLALQDDSITVEDDGHGMTLEEFRRFWMRVGTTHKQSEERSRQFRRPLTGSKGVGRLAVQFLADHIDMVTRAPGESRFLQVRVSWADAIEAGDLTQAVADFRFLDEHPLFPNKCHHGTKIILKGLKQTWDDPVRAVDLAKQLWMLQPPFEGPEATPRGSAFFEIDFTSTLEDVETAFRRQMGSVLENWDARLVGRIRDGRASESGSLVLEFRDGRSYIEKVPMPDCLVDSADFEVRIFRLRGKQRHGVAVADAREYLNEFGGVHIYDAGFRLPYYGPEEDWLGVERDFAGRLTASDLLPKEFRFRRSLLDLPSIRNLFGSVRIDTGEEMREAEGLKLSGEVLRVQMSRDRLVSNQAFEHLKRFVRWSLDYYAFRVSVDKAERIEELRPIEPPEHKLERVRVLLDDYRETIPASVYSELSTELTEYTEAVQGEANAREARFSLLGPLATAGMAALAFEHETGRELTRLERIARGLRDLAKAAPPDAAEPIGTFAAELDDWVIRVRANRRLFSALANEEDREELRRYRVRDVLDITVDLVQPLVAGADISVEVEDGEALFPIGAMADWQALLQNVLTNAANATLGRPERNVTCRLQGPDRGRMALHILDTGVGVDLDSEQELFEPFARRLDVPADYKSLVIGGQGLGLAIVRMIAENRRCTVRFVVPDPGFSSCFEMTWSDS